MALYGLDYFYYYYYLTDLADRFRVRIRDRCTVRSHVILWKCIAVANLHSLVSYSCCFTWCLSEKNAWADTGRGGWGDSGDYSHPLPEREKNILFDHKSNLYTANYAHVLIHKCIKFSRKPRPQFTSGFQSSKKNRRSAMHWNVC